LEVEDALVENALHPEMKRGSIAAAHDFNRAFEKAALRRVV